MMNRYCSYAIVGIVLEWMSNNFPVTPIELTEQLVHTMQALLNDVSIKCKEPITSFQELKLETSI